MTETSGQHVSRGGPSWLLPLILLAAASASPRPGAAEPGPMPFESPQASRDGDRSGLFMRSRDGATAGPAPLLDTDVEIAITGIVARARVIQRFRNPGDAWMEAIYVFPLPENAAVDRLVMQVGDQLIEGEIRERERARREYARARRGGKRAALMEQQRANVFTASIANIAPGDEIEIAIEYQQTLHPDAGALRLRFPMRVAHRELGSEPVAPAADGARPESPGAAAAGSGSTLGDAAGTLPEASRIPVRLRVDLIAGFPLASVASPSHSPSVLDLGEGRRGIDLDADASRDFVLEWRPALGAEPRAVLVAEPSPAADGETAVLLMLTPAAAETSAAHLPRECVFVIDTSGSMAGASIRHARKAFSLALERLGPDDRFNVIAFDSEVRALFPATVAATRSSRAAAQRFVDALHADGGTELGAALDRALHDEGSRAHLRQVIFLTDGAVGGERQLLERIHTRIGRSRLFTVGLGAAPNTHLLKRAARIGRGTFTFVASASELGTRMEALFAKLERPVLREVEVHWNDRVEMWPARVPDLYAGEPVVVTARVPRFVGEVIVTGDRGGHHWEVRVPLEAPQPDARQRGIGRLWARRKIEDRMEGLALGEDPEAVRRDVTAVALEHHLVSRYTSLVAIERTPVRPASAGLRRGIAPADWSLDGARFAGGLPRAATPAALQMLSGAALLVAAGACLGHRGRRSGARGAAARS